MKRLRFSLALAFSLVAVAAHAGESAASLETAGMPADCADYAANVSSSEGNFTSTSPTINGVTCYGAFQFCSAPGSSVGGTFGQYNQGLSPQQFEDNPQAQVAAWQQYEQNSWSQAQKNGLTSAVGQNVCYAGQCATLTDSSILKACQFGCGKGGKLDNFVKSGFNCNAPGTKDGAGTSVCKYLISGAGQGVGCITGNKAQCLWTGSDTPTTTTTTTAATADPQIAATDTNVGVADV